MPIHFNSKPEPYTVRFDGEPVRLHFKRMSVGEFTEYDAIFGAFGSGRLTPGPEPIAKPDSAPASLKDVCAAAAAAGVVAEDHATWIRSVFQQYITVEPGDITIDDEMVTAGDRFLTAIIGTAGYEAIVIDVLSELWLEHKLTPLQKKTSRLRLGSATGSDPVPLMAIAGATPATVAMSVDRGSSASPEVVTAPSKPGLSGMTAPPSSGLVRSARSRRRPTGRLESSDSAMRPSSSGLAG